LDLNGLAKKFKKVDKLIVLGAIFKHKAKIDKKHVRRIAMLQCDKKFFKEFALYVAQHKLFRG